MVLCENKLESKSPIEETSNIEIKKIQNEKIMEIFQYKDEVTPPESKTIPVRYGSQPFGLDVCGVERKSFDCCDGEADETDVDSMLKLNIV